MALGSVTCEGDIGWLTEEVATPDAGLHECNDRAHGGDAQARACSYYVRTS